MYSLGESQWQVDKSRTLFHITWSTVVFTCVTFVSSLVIALNSCVSSISILEEIYSRVPKAYKLIVEEKDNVERIIFHLMFQCLNENVISNILFRRLWAYLTNLRYYCNEKVINLTILHKLIKELQITKDFDLRKEIFSRIIEIPEFVLGESGLFILCDKYLKIEDKEASEVILECIRKIIHWLVLDNSLIINHELIVKMMKNRKTEIPFRSSSMVARLCFELNPIICLSIDEVLQVICTIKKYFKY
ncbi:hypothetical protein ABK040_001982 [Willaertia magna]